MSLNMRFETTIKYIFMVILKQKKLYSFVRCLIYSINFNKIL